MIHSKSKPIHLKTTCLLFLLILPVVSTFVVNHPSTATKQITRLHLHVDPIHLHRDSLLRLDDPMLLGQESTHRWPSNKELHKFTNSIAPLVLAVYLVGWYLTHHSTGGGDSVEAGRMAIDPTFGGGMLIGVGLWMMKWSVERTFLSPP